ncbi:hypothetical protein QBC36DRAFT_13430 [Triangularia setosa]|uniref:Uncharacterized protein n=1 Tax=Triangularia setosa TaxID=2587417 RepID=A0AAN6W837_9PEZI|nr:hypothetical protein QBC36DRAFT_13430 [Podospora setosa]
MYPGYGVTQNIMSPKAASKLGLDIYPNTETFTLADGSTIESKGIVSTKYSFPGEESPEQPIEFDIIDNLVVDILVGRSFLEGTETLTKHTERISVVPRRPITPLPRILHISMSSVFFRCYLNHLEVYANADTGAEMNLMSEEFVKKHRLASAPPDDNHQSVFLANGSTVGILGMVLARFNPIQKTEPTAPHSQMKLFYILRNLTSDVLLGRDLLIEIQAFV